MKVFLEEEEDVLILTHNSWATLFGEKPDIIKDMETGDSFSGHFDFSISPSGKKIAYSAFTLGEMDVRSGSTYIYNPKDSTSFLVSSKVVLGSWYDGEHHWLPNSNLLLHCSECNELIFVDTKENKVNTIEQVIFFQAAPFSK